VDCRLCSPELSPILGEGRGWRWVLNRNQDLLGKSMLVARDHVERVTDLSEPTWEELHRFLRVVSRRTDEVLAPTRVNLAFLGNEDAHVHLHLLPRYAAPVTLTEVTFEDPGFPGHYAVGRDGRVDAATLGAIADRLRLPPMDPNETIFDHFLPPRRMRPTALCVLSRGEEILVGEGHDPDSGRTFLRPPGGEVEFGALAADAQEREGREERDGQDRKDG
jgi:diadenosine tetraphosphate (Ap4A) HIT family hydrolase